MKLAINALTKFILGIVLVGALLFLPAWTLNFPGAWMFLALLFAPMMILGTVLLIRSPQLLEKRLDNKEKEGAQKGVIGLAGLMFPAVFIVSGLDFRLGWSSVPTYLVTISSVLFLFGYAMYAEVMRENAYLSRTVKVQKDQAVVSTGLYSVVRHPMYLATLFMFLPMPLILGSFSGLIPMLAYPVLIVTRIINEEKLLSRELDGYTDYKSKVKYRLIPFIW